MVSQKAWDEYSLAQKIEHFTNLKSGTQKWIEVIALIEGIASVLLILIGLVVPVLIPFGVAGLIALPFLLAVGQVVTLLRKIANFQRLQLLELAEVQQ